MRLSIPDASSHIFAPTFSPASVAADVAETEVMTSSDPVQSVRPAEVSKILAVKFAFPFCYL